VTFSFSQQAVELADDATATSPHCGESVGTSSVDLEIEL